MKHISRFIILFIFIFCTSCDGQKKPELTKEDIKAKTMAAANGSAMEENKNYHSKYIYVDSSGKQVTIENSYPKGGSKYTDLNGDSCTYATFFTRIINETEEPLEVKIKFTPDFHELFSIPGRSFKILLPPDPMTLDKASLYSYGLENVKTFLDNNHDKSTSLDKTINPNEASSFYVVMLNQRPKLSILSKGALRTGFILKGQNLYYSFKIVCKEDDPLMTDLEILCGTINLNLIPIK